ncbi:MAG: hypothetical protein AAGA56_09395 [Myxococcota bacterium]
MSAKRTTPCDLLSLASCDARGAVDHSRRRERDLNHAASQLIIGNFFLLTKASTEEAKPFSLDHLGCEVAHRAGEDAMSLTRLVSCKADFEGRQVELSKETGAILYAIFGDEDCAMGRCVFHVPRLHCEPKVQRCRLTVTPRMAEP